MGTGRAAEFDADVTDFGSVKERSSGPVEASEAPHRPKKMTVKRPNDGLIPSLLP